MILTFYCIVAISAEATPNEAVVDQAAPVGDEVSKLANQFSLPEDYDISVRHPDSKECMLIVLFYYSFIQTFCSHATVTGTYVCRTRCS